MLGTGGGGTAIAPIVAGVLFQAEFALQTAAICVGVSSLVAAACLAMVRVDRRGDRDAF